jgi:hypothetical protein
MYVSKFKSISNDFKSRYVLLVNKALSLTWWGFFIAFLVDIRYINIKSNNDKPVGKSWSLANLRSGKALLFYKNSYFCKMAGMYFIKNSHFAISSTLNLVFSY